MPAYKHMREKSREELAEDYERLQNREQAITCIAGFLGVSVLVVMFVLVCMGMQ